MLNNHPALFTNEPFADVILSELSAAFVRLEKHHAKVRDAGFISIIFPHIEWFVINPYALNRHHVHLQLKMNKCYIKNDVFQSRHAMSYFILRIVMEPKAA